MIPYVSGKRKNPGVMLSDVGQMIASKDVFDEASKKEFLWLLLRQRIDSSLQPTSVQTGQNIPGWSGFNEIMDAESSLMHRQSVIGYCEVIDKPPTELQVLYNVLKRSTEMANEVRQEDVVIFFDQAMYAKILEVIWKNPLEFERIVPCMGGFHVACTYMAVIGKRFKDAGLYDILIESGLLGSGSINGVIEGKHYNRAIRIHKVAYEALHQLRWEVFLQKLELMGDQTELADEIKLICEDRNVSNRAIKRLSQKKEFTDIFQRYTEFCDNPDGPMAEYWSSYMKMVSILLQFIRATREGNWQLYLNSLKLMLPMIFAYDRLNYARY